MRWIAPEEFSDKDLFRIVVFFVFHCPCKSLLAMNRTLDEYGWTSPWKAPYHLNWQLKRAASNYNLIFSSKNYDAMEEALKKANLYDDFPNDLKNERVCIYDREKNQFMSVFYHLRNAFAHCRLNMVDVDGECVFVLEDVVPNYKTGKNKLSARMIIKKSTLLKWIDLIEGGEKECSTK